MVKIYPDKLQKGDEVRVVAPSNSFSIISEQNREIAKRRFEEMGLSVSFGKHIEEMDEFGSSSIESRLADLHEAFTDKHVKVVATVIGGFNCNQLISHLDYDLILKNPKILIGYSDTTALQNAIFAKTGVVTYSAPAYSTFAQEGHFEYTMESFKQCLFSEEAYDISTSESWTDDHWYENQNNRTLIPNEGWLVVNEGNAEGTLIGGNLCTLNLLQGTEFMPSLKDTILFLEDDEESRDVLFDRDLQSLIHQTDFAGVRGIVVGRFQKASGMTNEKLLKILKTKKELKNIPIVANVDFGHTSPIITFPIGGDVKIEIKEGASSITIEKH